MGHILSICRHCMNDDESVENGITPSTQEVCVAEIEKSSTVAEIDKPTSPLSPGWDMIEETKHPI